MLRIADYTERERERERQRETEREREREREILVQLTTSEKESFFLPKIALVSRYSKLCRDGFHNSTPPHLARFPYKCTLTP